MPGGGAAQPAVPGGDAPLIFTLGHLQEAARSRQTVGRDEASAAFQTLLHHHHGETAPGAVDITDGSAFDWLRWVAGIEGARGVMRHGVHRVYVVRWELNGAPEAVICYGNNTYSTLVPHTARYTRTEQDAVCVLQRGQLDDRALAVCGPCSSWGMAAVAGSGDLGVISGKRYVVLLSLHSGARVPRLLVSWHAR